MAFIAPCHFSKILEKKSKAIVKVTLPVIHWRQISSESDAASRSSKCTHVVIIVVNQIYRL